MMPATVCASSRGGAANELGFYQVNAVDARSPWDRSLSNGCCARYLSPPDAWYLKPIVRQLRDYSKEKPASDDAFAALKRFYTCESGELKSAVDAVDESNGDWRKEKVSFQSCYGDERVFIIFTCRRSVGRRFNASCTAPARTRTRHPSSENLSGFGRVDFVICSGRAVFWPVINGQYERSGKHSTAQVRGGKNRDRRIKPVLDMLRSVEYLESRLDILKNGIAYEGTMGSVPGSMSSLSIRDSGRLSCWMEALPTGVAVGPEMDPLNFAPRVCLSLW